MVRVRLRNPGIIAMPISDEELKEYEDGTKSDEFLYVLYRLPGSGGIEIGMMSSSAINYYPGLANISRLDDATTKAYFYCGGSNLMNQAMEITDRPVYLIGPSANRTPICIIISLFIPIFINHPLFYEVLFEPPFLFL